MWIHKKNRNLIRLFFFHDFFCHLLGVHLNIIVHTDLKRLACHRFYPVFLCIFKFDPSCISQRKNRARDSFHIFVILYFQSDDSLIIASRKSKYFGCQFSVRIISFEIFIYFYTVISTGANSIPCFLLHIGFDSFNRTDLFHPFAYSLFRKL